MIHPNIIICSFTWIYTILLPIFRETKVSQLMCSGTFWPFSVCRNHHSWEGTTSLSQVLCLPRVESELSPPEVFLYSCVSGVKRILAKSQKNLFLWKSAQSVEPALVCYTQPQIQWASNPYLRVLTYSLTSQVRDAILVWVLAFLKGDPRVECRLTLTLIEFDSEIPVETQRRTECKEKEFNMRGHPHTWEWQEEKDKEKGRVVCEPCSF